MLQCFTLCCSVLKWLLQCVHGKAVHEAVLRDVLQLLLQYVCCVLQCVAVCCSVLQCVLVLGVVCCIVL